MSLFPSSNRSPGDYHQDDNDDVNDDVDDYVDDETNDDINCDVKDDDNYNTYDGVCYNVSFSVIQTFIC